LYELTICFIYHFRLGLLSPKKIQWELVTTADGISQKSDMFPNLKEKIRQNEDTDCKIKIGSGARYNCHAIVLQIYSKYVSALESYREISLPEDRVSELGFQLVYEWMIAEPEDAHKVLRRDNILDIFIASDYLEIEGRSLSRNGPFHEYQLFTTFWFCKWLIPVEESIPDGLLVVSNNVIGIGKCGFSCFQI